MIPATHLVSRARSWIDVPFTEHGRSREGVDCVGLIVCSLRECGAVDDTFCTDLGDYQLIPRGRWIERYVRSHCERLSERVPGALVLFRVIKYGWPAQLSLATDRGVLLATPRRGVSEVRLLDQTLVHSIWALPGVAYAGR